MAQELVTLKVTLNDDTRRFSLSKDQCTLSELVKVLAGLFPSTDLSTTHLTYMDEDGDVIRVTSEMEMKEALNQSQKQGKNVVKFDLVKPGEVKKRKNEVDAQALMESVAARTDPSAPSAPSTAAPAANTNATSNVRRETTPLDMGMDFLSSLPEEVLRMFGMGNGGCHGMGPRFEVEVQGPCGSGQAMWGPGGVGPWGSINMGRPGRGGGPRRFGCGGQFGNRFRNKFRRIASDFNVETLQLMMRAAAAVYASGEHEKVMKTIKEMMPNLIAVASELKSMQHQAIHEHKQARLNAQTQSQSQSSEGQGQAQAQTQTQDGTTNVNINVNTQGGSGSWNLFGEDWDVQGPLISEAKFNELFMDALVAKLVQNGVSDASIEQISQALRALIKEPVFSIVVKWLTKNLLFQGDEWDHSQIHFGVVCDACNQGPIVGLRYHCQNCPDFDACANCFADFSKVRNAGCTHNESDFLAIQRSWDPKVRGQEPKIVPDAPLNPGDRGPAVIHLKTVLAELGLFPAANLRNWHVMNYGPMLEQSIRNVRATYLANEQVEGESTEGGYDAMVRAMLLSLLEDKRAKDAASSTASGAASSGAGPSTSVPMESA